jgi:hypothetical protein
MARETGEVDVSDWIYWVFSYSSAANGSRRPTMSRAKHRRARTVLPSEHGQHRVGDRVKQFNVASIDSEA